VPITPEISRAGARLAGLHRGSNVLDPEVVQAARQDLATAKLARYVAEIVAGAPPLRPEQRERLVALLRGDSVA